MIRANVLSNYFVPGIILCSSHNPDKCPMKQGQVSYEASSFILSILQRRKRRQGVVGKLAQGHREWS